MTSESTRAPGLERLFQLRAHGSTVGTELPAALVIFLTLVASYAFVQPG